MTEHSSFANAPLEVLQFIFQKVSKTDAHRCKSVCKIWYNAYHQLIGSAVAIKTDDDMNGFLELARNNPIYGNGIKSINLPLAQLSPVTIQKLLEDMSKAIREACPNIETVFCGDYYQSKEYYHVLYNLRETIKHITLLPNQYNTSQLKTDPYDYLGSFPRLTSLDTHHWSNSLSTCLPIFEQPFRLEKLKCEFGGWDNRDLFNTYFGGKSHEEKALILDKLSTLRHVDLDLRFGYQPPIVVKFVTKFLKGLGNLNIRYDYDNGERDLDALDTPFKTLVPFAATLNNFQFDSTFFDKRHLMRNLATTVKNVYYKKDSDSRKLHRKLKLSLHKDEMSGRIDFDMDEEQCYDLNVSCVNTSPTESTRFVHILCINDLRYEKLEGLWDADLRLKDVKSFEFELITEKVYSIVYSHFFQVLSQLQKLRELKLTIPFDKWSKGISGVYPFVSKLEINNNNSCEATYDTFRTKLKKMISAFPNLKHLTLRGLHYNADSSNKRVYRYHLDKCNLKSLTIFLHIRSDTASNDTRYLIQVKLLHKREKVCFKLNRENQKLEQITESERRTARAHAHYLISIRSLEMLIIHEDNGIPEGGFESKVVLRKLNNINI